MSVRLSKVLNSEVMAQLKGLFTEKELRDGLNNQNSEVFKTMGRLKKEKLDDFDNIKQQFPNATEEKLLKIYDETKEVTTWNERLRGFTNIGKDVAWVKNRAMIGSVALGGLSLYYLRSNYLIGSANLIGTLAMATLWRTSSQVEQATDELSAIWVTCLRKTSSETADAVAEVFAKAKEGSLLIRFYLNAQEKLIPNQENVPFSTTFSKEVVEAFQSWKSTLKTQGNGDPKVIQDFFKRFEKVNSFAQRSSMLWMMGSAAFTYYAFKQRAYLMILAGCIHVGVSFKIRGKYSALELASRKISIAKEDELLSVYKKFFPKATDLKKLHSAIVIPFDAMLKMIPAWKNLSSLQANRG